MCILGWWFYWCRYPRFTYIVQRCPNSRDILIPCDSPTIYDVYKRYNKDLICADCVKKAKEKREKESRDRRYKRDDAERKRNRHNGDRKTRTSARR